MQNLNPSRGRAARCALVAAVFLSSLMIPVPAVSAMQDGVVISEILAVNQGSVTGIYDAAGDSPDFIELANLGDNPAVLNDHLLVDGNGLWAFPPGTVIPVGGFLRVWASGKGLAGGPMHTDFELSRSGEYLALIDGNSHVVDEIAPGYPPQQANVSWGRLPDGALGFMSTPTPGALNIAGQSSSATDPVAEVGRGFYRSTVVETLTTSPGARIHYTLDGTQPTESSALYQRPLSISPHPDGIVTLRARAFVSGGLASSEKSWSYIFPDALYSGPAGQGLWSLPAVSLTTDDGAYPVDSQKQRAALEFVDTNPLREGFAVTAGVKEFGESSVEFEKSNFRLFFDSDFGPSDLVYPVFDGYGQGVIEPTHVFDKLELRGGSWDSWQAAAGGRFAPSDYYLTDRFIRDIRLDMGGLSTHGRFVNVWVNGDYRGFYQLRERFDHAFYASYAADGESSDSIEAIKQNEGRYSNNGDQNVNGDGRVFDGLTGNYQQDKDWVDAEALIDFTMTMSLGEHDFEQEHRGVGSMVASSPNDYIFIYNDNDMRLRPVSNVLSGPIGFSPGYFVPDLVPFFEGYRADPEFLQLARRRAEQHFCGDGALTVTSMLERLNFWRSEIALAMRAEDVRWDGWSSIDYFGRHNVADKYGSWMQNMTSIESRIPDLMPDMYDAWQREGLFGGCANRMPTVDVTDRVDPIGRGLAVTMVASDPDGDALSMVASGLPPGLALEAATGLVSGTPTAGGDFAVVVRVEDPLGAWAEAPMIWKVRSGEPLAGRIVINEVMFHPSESEVPFGFDADLAGFIELHNPTTDSVDLSGTSFGDGVDFLFPEGSEIEAGDYLVLAESSTAFERTYGYAADFDYSGGLANDGERLELVDRFGQTIDVVEFDDEAPWAPEADGGGASLELRSAGLDNDDAGAWDGSAWPGGSPGQANHATGADANCDGVVEIVDAMLVAQFNAGNRVDAGSCPLGDPLLQINARAGDVSDDGVTNVVDALLISQCVVGIANSACPSE